MAATTSSTSSSPDDICRICLNGPRDEDGPFIAPCNCSGSQRWVHRGCLQEWQRTTMRDKDRLRALRCTVCGSFFRCGMLGPPSQEASKDNDSPDIPQWKMTLLAVMGTVMFVIFHLCLSFGESLEVKDLGAGSLLIATEAIRWGVFKQSVVLMVEHSRRGAKGYIVNRPYNTSGASVWSELPPRDATTGLPVAIAGEEGYGGPVETSSHVAYLYENATRCGRSRYVMDGVWLRYDFKSRKLPANAGVPEPRSRLHGYAGWAPRQLEAEINRGSWKVIKGAEDLVFSKDPEGLWRTLTDRLQEEEEKAHRLQEEERGHRLQHGERADRLLQEDSKEL
eukprot:TRINITY_DN9489_c1_g1_i2.p1 TRINITY_DN9489_c1_g1~~TRINITY_DN9489_c1_g1_i2.p1  ORF type:complete len:395 (+),score=34.81 TRINITY_DN9489_c1_g1_i2:176-1186(+)